MRILLAVVLLSVSSFLKAQLGDAQDTFSGSCTNSTIADNVFKVLGNCSSLVTVDDFKDSVGNCKNSTLGSMAIGFVDKVNNTLNSTTCHWLSEKLKVMIVGSTQITTTNNVIDDKFHGIYPERNYSMPKNTSVPETTNSPVMVVVKALAEGCSNLTNLMNNYTQGENCTEEAGLIGQEEGSDIFTEYGLPAVITIAGIAGVASVAACVYAYKNRHQNDSGNKKVDKDTKYTSVDLGSVELRTDKQTL